MENGKTFWRACNLFSTEESFQHDEKVTLKENKRTISNKKRVANVFILQTLTNPYRHF